MRDNHSGLSIHYGLGFRERRTSRCRAFTAPVEKKKQLQNALAKGFHAGFLTARAGLMKKRSPLEVFAKFNWTMDCYLPIRGN